MSEETSTSANKNLPKRKYDKTNSPKETNALKETDAPKEAKKPPMPVYGKYNVLKMLKENHCLIADERQLTNAFPRNKRYDLDDIKGM